MKYTNSFFYYSLLAGLIIATTDAGAAGIRVGNLSRSNAQGYQQVNEMRYQAQQPTKITEPAPVNLPINVTNSQLAQQIKDGTASVGVTQLEKCSAVYPNGEFAWTKPTMGVGAGGATTCTAVIEMRAIGAGENGADAIVARGYLGAGDSIVCNISQWPEYTLLPAAGEIEFPADAEPTKDDVIKVLNQEQKQNAALKIAAGTVLFGLGGNVIGENAAGHEGLLGGGKDKAKSTALGALGGAALMAGNVYGGKVAGDVILSTGVNAAAGAVMGNIVASGDSVLMIENCIVDGFETKCLWGMVQQTADLGGTAYVSANNPSVFQVCDNESNCNRADIDATNATIEGYSYVAGNGNNVDLKNRTTGGKLTLEDMFQQDKFQSALNKVCIKNGKIDTDTHLQNCTDIYVKLDGDPRRISSRLPAMVVDVKDKGMGWHKDEWNEFKKTFANNKIVSRSGNGIAGNLPAGLRPDNTDPTLGGGTVSFVPSYRNASDGGVIDMNNKARLKGTLTGAGVGGGIGAFTGYQGAQQDIEDRWLAAVREYKDSLGKVYCITGNRFLSQYNDVVFIPQMSEDK